MDRNPDDPKRPTNSGNTVYALNPAGVQALSAYGTSSFVAEAQGFIDAHGSLSDVYRRERETHQIPLKLADGTTLQFSPGKHNELQVAIVEELGPLFAPGATLLYIGDTASKYLVSENEMLADLGIIIADHDKLPDVVMYMEDRNWLFLVEAVTSHGPVDAKRFEEIEAMMRDCTADRVYVSAFLGRDEFRKWVVDIAWETEVWIAADPTHLIHFNGEKFLGPYSPR